LEPIGAVATEGKLVRVNVSTGAAAMLETVRLLDAAHLTPTTMMLREPTLDDVFLALTGHAAEEPTDDDSAAPQSRRAARSRT
jgi:ABC-2 type transport system ATP-binding protein